MGLSTLMFAGAKKNVRYHSHNDRAINISKVHMVDHGIISTNNRLNPLPVHLKELAMMASTHEDLYKAAGNQPYYQVLPIHSLSSPGTLLNGTRLQLDKGTAEGWDFSICTPSNKKRSTAFEQELNHSFSNLEQSLLEFYATSHMKNPDQTLIFSIKQAVTRHALGLFYYWVNYAPLTRGTSATGYAILYSAILAIGEELTDKLPRNIQLDWEAMFTPHPNDFVEKALPWVSKRQTSRLAQGGDMFFGSSGCSIHQGSRVRDVFDSMHDIVIAMNI
eukprot:CAMPEP_0119045292 /NCGR_PEP_ID=MMETSP1177-20130426/38746_1 /TAXON_ID=2985 /ORGANISM="Ochromonas sp, Strain CCMP1899" /LENGTH=275 /DNA_ID=CAMNT_0007016819 /DNA_START=1 /DNA_END=828 /DNA_ORIENTATION=-